MHFEMMIVGQIQTNMEMQIACAVGVGNDKMRGFQPFQDHMLYGLYSMPINMPVHLHIYLHMLFGINKGEGFGSSERLAAQSCERQHRNHCEKHCRFADWYSSFLH